LAIHDSLDHHPRSADDRLRALSKTSGMKIAWAVPEAFRGRPGDPRARKSPRDGVPWLRRQEKASRTPSPSSFHVKTGQGRRPYAFFTPYSPKDAVPQRFSDRSGPGRRLRPPRAPARLRGRHPSRCFHHL